MLFSTSQTTTSIIHTHRMSQDCLEFYSFIIPVNSSNTYSIDAIAGIAQRNMNIKYWDTFHNCCTMSIIKNMNFIIVSVTIS